MSSVSGRAPVLDADFVAGALGETLRERHGSGARFRRAVIDSRRVEAGDLFVALRGENADGHDFAADALARGAAGLLLERPPEGDLPDEAAIFIVADALAGLQGLAAAWREALDGLEVIGVTGNVGKTTTKLMASAVLERRYRVRTSALNYNNEIGVPLCLLELDPGIERTVIEHGMYTTGEIAQLCTWTRPRVGVVLNVGPVHLERAGSLEAIARAKRELVEALPAGGHALLNADDPVVDAMADHTAAQVLRFGTVEDADVRGSEVASHGAGGFSFTLEADGERRRVRVPLPGAHLLPNVLAAAATGLVEGVPFPEVAAALEALDVPLRLTVRCLPGGVTLLDDTYNASPGGDAGRPRSAGRAVRPPHRAARRHAGAGRPGGVLARAGRATRREPCRCAVHGRRPRGHDRASRARGRPRCRTPARLEGGSRRGVAGAAAAGRRAARQGFARARPRDGRRGIGGVAGRRTGRRAHGGENGS